MTLSSTENYGIVIAGHGSQDPEGVREFEQLVNRIRDRACPRRVNYGFLEFARPTIDDAVRSAIEAGEQRIAIVPLILLAATHAKNDMPVEVLALQQEFPKTKLHYGAALHLHPNILRLLRRRFLRPGVVSVLMRPRSSHFTGVATSHRFRSIWCMSSKIIATRS